MRAGLLALTSALAACTVKDPLFCDPTHPCTDPTRPYCDTSGTYDPDHIRNTCVPTPAGAVDAGPDAVVPDAAPTPAMLSFGEASHDFHDVVMGSESFLAQLTVTNHGQLTSSAIAVTVSGTNASSFIVVPTGDTTDCDGKQLPGGMSCVIQVKYRAGTPGGESATVHADATDGGMAFEGLLGNSLAQGALEITAGATLAFGNQPITTMSAPQTITIHNKGGVPCTNLMAVVQDAADYTKTASTCGASLAAGASCDVSVRFNPASVGALQSSVTFSSDQAGTAAQLQGTGTGDVAVTKIGTGTVADTLGTPIISCGTTCTGTYSQSPITLHATTTGGIPFDGWSGACTGAAADCVLSLTMPTTNVTATFGVCKPGTGQCTTGNLSICDSTGHWGTPSACPLGCYTDGTRCWDVDPSNGLAAALDNAASGPALILTDGATINTANGDVINGDSTVVTVPSVIVQQLNAAGNPIGPDIRVFEVKSAQLGATQIVAATGKAFAIVSDGDIVIQGEIAAYGTGAMSGPGSIQCGGNGTGDGSYSLTPKGSTQYAGGGGASYGGFGRTGGSNGAVNGGGPGVLEGDSTLHPLRGGCAGGAVYQDAGGLFPATVAAPAYGGGAVQMVSRTSIAIRLNGGAAGAINVGGGGGNPMGGGGGAGGGILLEAPQVVVTGAGVALAANGGGGGGGCGNGGQHGLPSAAPAQGGQCSTSTTKSGGNGATATTGATNGTSFSAATPGGYAGGAGGGYGRITVSTASGSFTLGAGAVSSPGASSSTVGKR